MPAAKPLVECPLVPTGSGVTTLYAPWFLTEIDLLIADEDADFMTALIFGLRDGRIDPHTALFAESDLLLNGWHTADTPQPDRAELHKTWSLLMTARVHLKRKS